MNYILDYLSPILVELKVWTECILDSLFDLEITNFKIINNIMNEVFGIKTFEAPRENNILVAISELFTDNKIISRELVC